MNFAKVFFSRTPFVLIVLVPVFLISGIGFFVLPFYFDDFTLAQFGIMFTLGLFCFVCVLGITFPGKYQWAPKLVTGTISIFYSLYLGSAAMDVLFRDGETEILFQPLAGFVIIGLPCLELTLPGRIQRLNAGPQVHLVTQKFLDEMRTESPKLFDEDRRYMDEEAVIFIVPEDHFDEDNEYIGNFYDIEGNFFGNHFDVKESQLGQGEGN